MTLFGLFFLAIKTPVDARLEEPKDSDSAQRENQ
jgi:hypothetical protein